MHSGTSPKTYLAFDLGAETGRAILATLRSGILTAQEIRRFKNDPVEYGGSLHWDIPRLWWELRTTLSELQQTKLAGIGVDSWGVDFAFLGERGELLQNPYHYRDARTSGMMERVFAEIRREEIYERTGIQFMPINTLYQLFAAKEQIPTILEGARNFLMIPDLLHYWLSGAVSCEFTNATTTQFVNARSRDWDFSLLDKLEIPRHFLGKIVESGTILGALLPSIAGGSDLRDTPVIAPATHDTGSAVAAVTARDGTAFLSSGTWSLLGTEVDAPVISGESLRSNFTNEGGIGGTTRLLKNVMGLWILQRCRDLWAKEDHRAGNESLMEVASQGERFASLIDPDHESFLHPRDMAASIDQFCSRTRQPKPATPGRYVRAILESLAFKYRLVLGNLEKLTGRKIERIRVIGGGSKNRLLNQWTADATGKVVLAGPAEATALGNAAMQMLASGEVESLAEVREIVERSFPPEVFEPVNTDHWEKQETRFRQYCEGEYA